MKFKKKKRKKGNPHILEADTSLLSLFFFVDPKRKTTLAFRNVTRTSEGAPEGSIKDERQHRARSCPSQ